MTVTMVVVQLLRHRRAHLAGVWRVSSDLNEAALLVVGPTSMPVMAKTLEMTLLVHSYMYLL